VVAEFDPRVISCIAGTPDRARRGDASGGGVTRQVTLAPDAVWQTRSRIHIRRDSGDVAGVADGTVVSITPARPPVVQTDQTAILARDGDDDDLGDLDAGLAGAVEGPPDTAALIEKLMPRAERANRRAFLPGTEVPIELCLASVDDHDLNGRLEAVHVPTGKTLSVADARVSLAKGAVARLQGRFTPDRAGTWVCRLRIQGWSQPLERAVHVDYPTGLYLPGAAAQPSPIGTEFDRYRKERYHAGPAAYDHSASAQKVTTDMPTPHIPYAKPLADGPLRLLTVIPLRAAREAVELMQRLDCGAETVLVGCHGYPGPDDSDKLAARKGPIDEVRAMRRALTTKPEVILLAATLWNWFPEDVRREILRQVIEDGALLFFASPIWVPDPFVTELGVRMVHGQGFGATPQVRRYGRGRIGFVGTRGGWPHYRTVFCHTERRLEDLIRAIVAGARGQPAVSVDLSKLGAAYTGDLSVTLKNTGETPFSGSVDAVVRLDLRAAYKQAYPVDHYGTPAYGALQSMAEVSDTLALAAGRSETVSLSLPPMPQGAYRLAVRVRDADGAVVTWRSLTQKTSPPFRVSNVRVVNPGDRAALRLYRQDTVAVSFDVTPVTDRKAPAGALTAFVSGRDRSNRVILDANKPFTPTAGTTSVTLEAPLQRVLHRHMAVIAGVRLGADSIAEHRVGILVDRPDRRNDFRFNLLDNENWIPHCTILVDDFGQYGDDEMAVVDGCGQGYGGLHGDPDGLSEQAAERKRLAQIAAKAKADAEKLMAKTTMGGVGGEPDGLALEDPEEVAKQRAAAAAAKLAKERFVRADCFNDPAHRAHWKAFLVNKLKPLSNGWARRIYADDEYVYGTIDTCQCDHCQTTFARYCRLTYGSLDRLNRAYGTSWKTFDEARLYSFGQGSKPGLPEKGPGPQDWPRAVDALMFKAWQYRDAVRDVRDHVRATFDPAFETGVSGMFHMRHGNFFTAGNDHWQLSQVGRAHAVYRDYEEWSSFVGSPAVFLWQSGYGKNYNPSHQAWHPWDFLRRGCYGFGHYTSNGYPMAAPDGSLHPGPAALFRELDRIRSGPAALLLGHDVRDPVAIHWSGPSFYLTALELWHRHGKTLHGPQRRMNHCTPSSVSPYFLRSFYLSHEQLEQGTTTFWDTPKLLIANYSSAMSPKEVAVVRDFVRNGGVLVAGVDMATRNEHGAPYATPPLDELFGIRRRGGRKPVLDDSLNAREEEKRLTATLTIPGTDKPIPFAPSFVAPNLEATTATAHGTFAMGEQTGKLFFVNRYGKGTAIHLNFPFYYGTGPVARPILQWASAQAGIHAFAWLEHSGHTTLGRFRDGDNRYLVVLRPYGQPPGHAVTPASRTTVRLLEKRHIYDARAGRYLGLLDRWQPDDSPQLARLYACLPYKVEGLQVSAPASVKPGAVVRLPVRLALNGGVAGRHVLRVDAVRPDGTKQRILGYNQTITGGAGDVELPLAYNAPAGEWRVTVRDVATGQQQHVALTVEAQ
jgi:hypothetical protein